MSLNGVGNTLPGLIGGESLRRGANDRVRTAGESQPAVTRREATAARTSRESAAALASAEPPPGTDPALWKVLTSDERQFFAASGARGPLTYGHLGRTQAAGAPVAARGARLDLRA